MTTFIYGRRVPVNKVLTLSSLILILIMFAGCAQMSPSVAKPTGISSENHDALVKYYEGVAKDAKLRLQENKEILQEYEAHPYYFGRQGMDAKSHAAANVRAFEKTIQESLISADLHRKMAMKQKSDQANKVGSNQDRDFKSKISGYSEYSGNTGL